MVPVGSVIVHAGSFAPPARALNRPGSTNEVLTELRSRGFQVAAAMLAGTLADLWDWMQGRKGSACERVPMAARPSLQPTLRDALAAIRLGLGSGGERRARSSELAHDSGEISAWLERHGALLSALAYAEAAAALEPHRGSRAVAVATLARRMGRAEQAVSWGRRGLWLAGVEGDSIGRGAALLELGHVARGRQRYTEASRLYSAARRLARLRQVQVTEGDALVALAGLYAELGHAGKSIDCFALAVDAYGPQRRLLERVGDLLSGLCLATRDYRGAASLAKVVLTDSVEPEVALVAAGHLARAGAALGWELTYEDAWNRAFIALGQLPMESPRAEPLLDLCRAAGSMGYWPRVKLVAEMAAADAARKGNRDAVELASRMLEAADMTVVPEPLLGELFPDEEHAVIPEGKGYPPGHMLRDFTERLRVALDTCG